MTEQDRVLGRLEEFHRWEIREHEELKHEIAEIRRAIDELNAFRWKMIGGAAVVSFITSGLGISVYQVLRNLHG